MRRFVFVAVAGLCSTVPTFAQESGYLAPTAPVVPAPVLHNGSVLNSSTGKPGVSRFLASPKWSPLRSPVTASSTGATALPPGYVPTQDAGMVVSAGSCPDGRCGSRHGHSCWQRLKTWLCFRYSSSDVPKFQPTPYVTPLQGMFPCEGYSCGGNIGAPPGLLRPWPPTPEAQPLPATGPASPPMTEPVSPRATPLPTPLPLRDAGVMPPRGTAGGAIVPTAVIPTTSGYNVTSWKANTWKSSAPSAVVPASGTRR